MNLKTVTSEQGDPEKSDVLRLCKRPTLFRVFVDCRSSLPPNPIFPPRFYIRQLRFPGVGSLTSTDTSGSSGFVLRTPTSFTVLPTSGLQSRGFPGKSEWRSFGRDRRKWGCKSINRGGPPRVPRVTIRDYDENGETPHIYLVTYLFKADKRSV